MTSSPSVSCFTIAGIQCFLFSCWLILSCFKSEVPPSVASPFTWAGQNWRGISHTSCSQTLPNSFIYSVVYLFIYFPPPVKWSAGILPSRLCNRNRSWQAALHRRAFALFARLLVLLLAKASDEQKHPRCMHHLRGHRGRTVGWALRIAMIPSVSASLLL